MGKGIEIIEEKKAVLLTPELAEKVMHMRENYAMIETGALTSNDDHGPWGQPPVMPFLKLKRSRIYTGTAETGSYNHHSQLTKFKDKYYYAWSNGLCNEERPQQRIMISSSTDGRHWTEGKCAIDADTEKGVIRNCVGLHGSDTELIIYCWTSVPLDDDKPLHNVRLEEAKRASIDTYVSKDGENWQLKQEKAIPGCTSHAMMFEAPRLTQQGKLLTGGSHDGPVAYLWDANDPAGKPEMFRIPTPEGQAWFPFGEATWYQRDDGEIIMFWRDEGLSMRLFVNSSSDGGRTWTAPVLSDFPDSVSRVRAGRLSDGRYFLSGNSYLKLFDRMHLMISISEDGYKFDKMYTVLNEPTAQRRKGLLKCHGYQYPTSCVDGDKLLLGYSINKEDIECATINIADI